MQVFNYFWYMVTEQIPHWIKDGPDIWFFIGPGFGLIAGLIFLGYVAYYWWTGEV